MSSHRRRCASILLPTYWYPAALTTRSESSQCRTRWRLLVSHSAHSFIRLNGLFYYSLEFMDYRDGHPFGHSICLHRTTDAPSILSVHISVPFARLTLLGLNEQHDFFSHFGWILVIRNVHYHTLYYLHMSHETHVARTTGVRSIIILFFDQFPFDTIRSVRSRRRACHVHRFISAFLFLFAS